MYFRLLRAYGLAYVSTTAAPKLLDLLLVLYKKKSARNRTFSSVCAVFSFPYCVVLEMISTRHIITIFVLTVGANIPADSGFLLRSTPLW